MIRISRDSTQIDCKIDTEPVDCTPIPLKGWAGATVIIPDGASVATLTIWGAHELGGTYYALNTAAAAACTVTVVENKMYALPDEIYACAAIKIVGDVDEPGASVFMKG